MFAWSQETPADQIERTITSLNDPARRGSDDLARTVGEAQFQFPDSRHSGTVFIGSDLALSESSCIYQRPGELTHSIPLLFVVKREGATWKSASLRILARQPLYEAALALRSSSPRTAAISAPGVNGF